MAYLAYYTPGWRSVGVVQHSFLFLFSLLVDTSEIPHKLHFHLL